MSRLLTLSMAHQKARSRNKHFDSHSLGRHRYRGLPDFRSSSQLRIRKCSEVDLLQQELSAYMFVIVERQLLLLRALH